MSYKWALIVSSNYKLLKLMNDDKLEIMLISFINMTFSFQEHFSDFVLLKTQFLVALIL